MKKLFTLLLVCISFSLSAQIDFAKDSSFAHGSGFEIPAKVQLTNNSTDTLFRIIRSRVENCAFPETAFCDQVLCYPADQDTAEVVIKADESFEFKLNFYPYSTTGKCQVVIVVESVKNPTTNVDSCWFQASNLVSIKEVPEVKTRVYPNPAKNEIRVETVNKNRYHVVIYDILGNEVLTVRDVLNDQSIDIEALPAGVYVLKVNGEVSSSTIFRTF